MSHHTNHSLGIKVSNSVLLATLAVLNLNLVQSTTPLTGADTVARHESLRAVPYAHANPAWAGYVVVVPSNKLISSVSGGWTVPRVQCPKAGPAISYAAEWIGIDGYNTTTVEQTGTETACQRGIPTYSAWVEMFAQSAAHSGSEYSLRSETYLVAPGDEMYAEVVAPTTGVSSKWRLTITNLSRNWVYTATESAPRQTRQHTVEWIVERPTIGKSTLAPLSRFGSVSFSNANYRVGNSNLALSSTRGELALVMAASNQLLASPSVTSPRTDGFTIMRH